MRGWMAGALVIAAFGCGDAKSSSGSGGTSTGGTSAGAGGGSAASTGSGAAGGAGGTGAGGEATAGTGGSGSTTTTSAASTGSGGGGGDPGWGVDQCQSPPAGVAVGYAIGDQLPEIVVKDCDGNDVSLKELCGASALWIFAAYGWCPLCKSVSEQQEVIHDSFAGQDLASVNIIIENGQGSTPDENFCKTWRAKFGMEDVRTFYDPTGAILALWPEQGTSSMSAFLDNDRVLVSRFVHSADVAAIKAGIHGALAH